MDSLTHALSGAVIAQALSPDKPRWWFPVWAALVAVSPDLDILFINSPVEYIEYHRGITHSFAGGWGIAFVCGLVLYILSSTKQRTTSLLTHPKQTWSLIGAWCFAYVLILHHIWLDCMNSYGTQVFLPFSTYRVRWNALFIVDPLLLIPLIAGLCMLAVWRRKGIAQGMMLCLALWTVLYPLGALGVRVALEKHLTRAMHREQQPFTQQFHGVQPSDQSDSAAWSSVHGLHLLPDAFTPFHWKLLLDRDKVWDVAGYTVFKALPETFTAYSKPPKPLWHLLREQDDSFRIYQDFALYPALDSMTTTGDSTEYVFHDLRFGSTIPFVDAIQTRRKGEDLAFRIMARVTLPDGIVGVRLITTKGAGGDSGWQPPLVEDPLQ